MIPHAEIQVHSFIPEEATFWFPSGDELGEPGEEGGIGHFRDTWYIGDVTLEEASEVAAEEQRIIELIDQAARTSPEFDVIATAIEFGNDPDGLPDDLSPSGAVTELKELAADDGGWAAATFQGLEIGVAGLVYALNATGCVTAASCRSHRRPDRRSWASHPVVYFAAPREIARRLAPLVERAGCGFNVDGERPGLLFVEAPSITCFIRLADAVLTAAGARP